jgi:hypothetical protein
MATVSPPMVAVVAGVHVRHGPPALLLGLSERGPDLVLDTPAFISASNVRLLDELLRVLPPWLD